MNNMLLDRRNLEMVEAMLYARAEAGIIDTFTDADATNLKNFVHIIYSFSEKNKINLIAFTLSDDPFELFVIFLKETCEEITGSIFINACEDPVFKLNNEYFDLYNESFSAKLLGMLK